MTRGISEERLLEEIRIAHYVGMDVYAASLLKLIRHCTELNPWLPIESAPDDREILLYYPDNVSSHKFIKAGTHNKTDIRQPTHFCELPDDPK